ncbi:MAG: hypothetical protein U1F76_00760 [Candidatus Competibacteraceae bacterium]
MKQTKIILLISSILILGACHRQSVQQPRKATATSVSSQAHKVFDPGEYPMDSPEVVWKQYNCETKQLPLVILESNSLSPATVSAGQQQINHLVNYVVCSEKNSGVIKGTINTKLYFRGKLITQNRRNVEFKPGRWSIVGVIPIPPNAKPGTYDLRTEFFTNRKIKLAPMSASFEVNR